jgi:hypothetical protein
MIILFRFFLFLFIFFPFFVFGQNYNSSYSIINEFVRRKSIMEDSTYLSESHLNTFGSSKSLFLSIQNNDSSFSSKKIDFLPVYFITKFDDKRPLNGGEFGLIPNVGFQKYISSGFVFKHSFLTIQLQPEFVISQNLPFAGFPNSFSSDVIQSRFYFWNMMDSPERFNNGISFQSFLGQSGLSLRLKSMELQIGTRNFSWGPGQFNSLIFSTNAPGFPHLSINSINPIKTILGNFEMQFIIGLLKSPKYNPSQIQELNVSYSIAKSEDSRYLNGFIWSYRNKWFPSLNMGVMRTFQYYNSSRPKDFMGWFPVFEPLAKEKLFANSNSALYDKRNQSQQLAVFFNYRPFGYEGEFYFQFGRRDHSLNWREFILNPEHARAYQFGFLKIVDLPSLSYSLQIRSEITHQQESVNRYLRYDLSGGQSWHSHSPIRSGFSNFGQSMGVSIGTGSNIQSMEIAFINDWKKIGLLFERLENNQDFFYRSIKQQNEPMPWIDWSASLLWNSSFKNLYFTARFQSTYAKNYQWALNKSSAVGFPVGKDLFSFHSQVNLIYFWNKSLDEE